MSRVATEIEVVDHFSPRSDRKLVRAAVLAALKVGRGKPKQVHILLTDDRSIGKLHAQFLGDPSPTDVMSFPGEDEWNIVISVACARRLARTHGHTIRAELALYIVHGVLHCCGYDDHTVAQRRRMRDAEQSVLHILGLHVDAF